MTPKKPYVSAGLIPSFFIQGSCFLVHMLKTAGSLTSSYANQMAQPYSFKIQTYLKETRFDLNDIFSQVFFLTIGYQLYNLRLETCSLGLVFYTLMDACSRQFPKGCQALVYGNVSNIGCKGSRSNSDGRRGRYPNWVRVTLHNAK